MKTPCQSDPEMWVSEFASSRREAAVLCRSCPAIDWCAKETAAAKPTHGVWAGRDYSKNDALRPRARVERPQQTKACAECSTVFERSYHTDRQWADQMYCSNSCGAAAGNRRRKEKAA